MTRGARSRHVKVRNRPRVAPARQPFHGTYVPAHRCQCGNRGFVSRQDAKTVAKEMHRERGLALRTYRCSLDERNWHVGPRDAA